MLQRAASVAPVRERGLKFYMARRVGIAPSRSREGAWIEMQSVVVGHVNAESIAPVRERGLKYHSPA